MNDYLEGLISELAYLERTIESMESHRNNTLSAIESISAVSEQTAASISVVNESLKNQITMVGNLHNSTIELKTGQGILWILSMLSNYLRITQIFTI